MIKKVLLITSLLIPINAFAGERVPAGTVLQEESYIFTIEEAKAIKEEIESLENALKKEKAKAELLSLLADNREKQVVDLNSIISFKDQQLNISREINIQDAERLAKIYKQQNLTKLERVGIFIGGAIFTGTAIYLADKVDDKLLENN